MDSPSILDTGMSMILPWRQSEKDKSKILSGWFNLLWLMLLCFIFSQFYENYSQYGAFITNFEFFQSLYSYFHELILIILPIYGFSFFAFLLQKLMAYEIFGPKYTRAILHLVQHLLQSILIFGMFRLYYFLTCISH